MILRVQSLAPQTQGFIDRTISGARCGGHHLRQILEQLDDALEHANIESGRCWVVLFHGFMLYFYEYHRGLPRCTGRVPWGPPDEEQRIAFEVRGDDVVIDRMFRHMAKNEIPPAR